MAIAERPMPNVTRPPQSWFKTTPPGPKRRVKRRFYRTAVWSSLVVIAIGLLGLASRFLPVISSLSDFPWYSIMLPPQAAWSFLILGASLYLYVEDSSHPKV